ncbi:MAG: Uma2 family endonuclease [Egibacteraceae bacterium]
MAVEDTTHPPSIRPLYRREYEALGELGFFADEDVELLDGRIVIAADEGSDHAAVTRRLNRILIEGIPAAEGEVGVGNPLGLSDLSEPQPDFMVIEPRSGYRAAHPTTASLVIEVAHASRRTDLGLKAVLYAAAGIPDYWVVDLTRDDIVVHRRPAGTTFAAITRHRDGVVRPLHHPGAAVDVRDLLR